MYNNFASWRLLLVPQKSEAFQRTAFRISKAFRTALPVPLASSFLIDEASSKRQETSSPAEDWERWLSGRKRLIANPLYEFFSYRGFESLSLRLIFNLLSLWTWLCLLTSK